MNTIKNFLEKRSSFLTTPTKNNSTVIDVNQMFSLLNDFSRNNLFMFEITVPILEREGFGPISNKIKYLCFSVNTPFPTLQDSIQRNKNLDVKIPTRYDKDAVTFSFYVDSRKDILQFFDAWHKKILLPNFSFGFKNEFQGQGSLYSFDRNMGVISRTNFVNMYPTQISGLDQSWEADDITKLQVGFNYDKITIDFVDKVTLKSRMT